MFKEILKKVLPNKDTKELESLHQIPKAEKGDNMPHFQDFKPNWTHQADLLFLPNDKGFKYALVVVDDATRLMDAVPLRSKTATSIVKGFIKIYNRNILSLPKVIEMDRGSEFRRETKEYFSMKGVRIRYANVNRHRQQALVEKKNYILGKAIFLIQNQKELETNKKSKEWVKYLKDIIETINEHIKKTHKIDNKSEKSPDPISTKESRNLLPVGTKVRVTLDYPEEVSSRKRLSGKFRAGDIRFSRNVYKITAVALRPGFPPMYNVDDGTTVQRTRQQLQVIN